MPMISLELSEIIKRRLFRAREHLQCLGGSILADLDRDKIALFAAATYLFNQELKLPAVKHMDQPLLLHYDDALMNLTTVIDFDLTQLQIQNGDAAEQAVIAAQEMLRSIQTIPLPARP